MALFVSDAKERELKASSSYNKLPDVLRAYLMNLNIADEGGVNISTIVHNCKFTVHYENSVQNQLVAETFLASVETLLATFADIELVILTPEIRVIVEGTTGTSSMKQGSSNAEYIFQVNHALLSDKEYWECFSFFMASFISLYTLSGYCRKSCHVISVSKAPLR